MHLPSTLRLGALATLLGALGLASPAASQQALPAAGVTDTLGAGTSQDYVIPTVNPPSHLQLTVKGGGGGDASTKKKNSCKSAGGNGAALSAFFAIGNGPTELAPGGHLRFLVGEAGGDDHENGPSPRAAGGGGGGWSGDGGHGCNSSTDLNGGYRGKSDGGDGGSGNDGRADGGWGCGGGGGGGGFSGGGGGGYSGGGGGGVSDPGGGGGSYSSSMALELQTWIDGSQDDGYAKISIVPADSGEFCNVPIQVPALQNGETYTTLVNTFGKLGTPGLFSCIGGFIDNADVWFVYRNDTAVERLLTVSTPQNISPHVAEFRTNDCSELLPIACVSIGFGGGVPIPVAAGEEMLVRIIAQSPAPSPPFTLEMRAPANVDSDGDGVIDFFDTCPNDAGNQVDSDHDGVGDLCDVCPGADDALDADSDGVPDACDVCPGDDDADADHDGVPDNCDLVVGDDHADGDADGVPDAVDACPGPETDCDGNGLCDHSDVDIGGGRFEIFAGSIAQQWTRNANFDGDDFEQGGVLLTDGGADQIASVVFEPVTAAPVADFLARFWVRSTPVTGAGGEGFVFSLLDADVHGANTLIGPEGVGDHALDVVFDSTSSGGGDPSGEHFTVYLDGVTKLEGAIPFELDSGEWLEVSVSMSAGRLSLVVRDIFGAQHTLANQVPLAGYQAMRVRYAVASVSAAQGSSLTVVDQFMFRDLTNDVDMNTDGVVDACQGEWIDRGHALAGVAGDPQLTGLGSLTGDDPAQLSLSQAAPGAPAYGVVGFGLLEAPFKGGVMVPTPDYIVGPLTLDGLGEVTIPFTWPVGVPSGFETHVQLWIVDPAGVLGYAASNGLTAKAF